MPITSTHPEYDARIKQWERCRDCAEGSDAVKSKGRRYVPSLRDQDQEDYDAYVQRALFYGATGRTIQGLTGAVFRKDPTIEIPDRYAELAEDITNGGRSAQDFARNTEDEVLTVGRVGILVDVAKGEANRAYASLYTAESIVNWGTERIEGKVQLVFVVLQETYKEKIPEDPFEAKILTQYRELRLEEGKYIQNIWRKEKNGENWLIAETIEPSRRAVPLDFIPFLFLNAYSIDAETEKPPLLDLVDVNLSHYRSSADLEHGAHFTALPTPWAAGFNTSKDFYLGSTKAWMTDRADANVGFLEYTGQGLSALESRMESKEKQMAVLGARLLEEPKRAVEAADTHKMRRSGEEGSLLTQVGTTSDALTQVMRWAVWWSGAEDSAVKGVEVELNRDFVNTQIDPSYLQQIMQAKQTGEISQETFLFNLKRGEVFPPGRTIEDEQAAIDKDLEDSMPETPFGRNVTRLPLAGEDGE